MQRVDSLEKTLMLGKIEGKRRRGRQRLRWLDGITDSIDVNQQNPGDSEGKPGVLQSQKDRSNLGTEQQKQWCLEFTQLLKDLEISAEQN